MEFIPFSIRKKEEEQLLTHEGIPILSLKMTYPEFFKKDSRAARRLNRFYQKITQEYIKTAKKHFMPIGICKYDECLENSREFIPFALSISYTVTENSPCCLSLYREITEKCGKGRPEVFRFGDVWDIRTGWPLSLRDFCGGKKYSRRQKELLAGILCTAEEQMKKSERQYYENYKKRIKKYFNPENFYRKDGQCILFYQENTIAPAFEGTIEFAFENCLQKIEE